MTAIVAAWDRCWAAALLTAALVAVLAGCSAPGDPGAAGSRSPSATPGVTVGVPVVLRFGDRVATATLTGTPASRQLAAMLPLTVQLKETWGQAKSGPLPHALTVDGATPVHDPVPGTIFYWSPTEVIAVYYDDLGQAVPDPGLVRLGVVETGLERLAGAGRQFTVRIELAAGTGS